MTSSTAQSTAQSWSAVDETDPGAATDVIWSARLISSAEIDGPAPLFRRRLLLDRPVADLVAARLHVSAWGIVECYLNGHRVSEDLFEPGWSSYQWRIRYRS
jgi:alpha-L-rhamnosidase